MRSVRNIRVGSGDGYAPRRQWSLGCRIIILMMCLSLGSSALAQGVTTHGAETPASTFISQAPPIHESAPSSVILPTDVVPLPAAQERTSFGENLQLRVLQRLPAPLYFNVSCEVSERLETNIFQFPMKRQLLHQFIGRDPRTFILENPRDFRQTLETINRADAFDTVFRVLPNLTWGWAFKPRTRVYGNYFMIRDSLSHWTQLNTVIHSLGYGIQQDIPVGRRGNLQADMQFRELWQLHSKPVFDFLPGLTFSYVATPRLVLFANALVQLRGHGYFRSPNSEIDPFYTWGGYYSKNGWAFSATSTFVQNFREPFRHNATIPVNNYSIISDFEIARRLIRQLPGVQAFARAEPIWNFHAHERPGLGGMDFRMFFGLRAQLGKPALTAAYEQIKQQLEEQETAPPEKAPGEAKPSAYLMPYQLIAGSSQPIHGFLAAEGVEPVAVALPKTQAPVISLLPPATTAAPAITAAPAAAESTDKASSKAAEIAKVVSSRQQSVKAEKKTQTVSSADRKHKAVKKPEEVKMVLVPPLPTVDSDSKANPFGDTGAQLKPPILMTPIR